MSTNKKKKIAGYVKLQLPAGKATPAPPLGPALGPYGANIMEFCKQFNDKTTKEMGLKVGLVVPVVITIYADRTFTFIIKTPPAAVLIKELCGFEKGSDNCKKNKIGTMSKKIIREIAEAKAPDLNSASVEAAERMVIGTAKSMGVMVEGSEEKVKVAKK